LSGDGVVDVPASLMLGVAENSHAVLMLAA
jgi:hypothetical protein